MGVTSCIYMWVSSLTSVHEVRKWTGPAHFPSNLLAKQHMVLFTVVKAHPKGGVDTGLLCSARVTIISFSGLCVAVT